MTLTMFTQKRKRKLSKKSQSYITYKLQIILFQIIATEKTKDNRSVYIFFLMSKSIKLIIAEDKNSIEGNFFFVELKRLVRFVRFLI